VAYPKKAQATGMSGRKQRSKRFRAQKQHSIEGSAGGGSKRSKVASVARKGGKAVPRGWR
jgi:hypothetical protein